ncbi:2Fe-2S iron-sulfur cluster-binding protein [Acidimangrovimonas sediminis]|uniref:2Fe-2S iron-sulfur cluster-binding protein n=1 Tax=Acidimangrovimonas sediminis TaxID=2056283 RepID=UPI000C800DB2|nr:2Fe-2S iron-sulfur cluster-binding protein [Acidimangrovimonas sediminis]
MPRITFVTADGQEITADATPGLSLMETARAAAIPGILAECGGACSCSTCHVYVDPSWYDRLPAMKEMEADLLDFAWEPHPDRSRLSCQIDVSEDMDGLRVTLPAQQG